MKARAHALGSAEEIDRMVDDIVRDPSRAGEYKTKLKSRLHLVEPSPPERPPYEEIEDLWDNVPV